MKRYRKEKREIVISKRKCFANIKRYFWIVIITVILGGMLSFALSDENTSLEKNDNNQYSNTAATTTQQVVGLPNYQAYAEIYIDTENEENKNGGVQVLTVSDYSAIAQSVTTIKVINEALQKAGMDVLNKDDFYSAYVLTGKIVIAYSNGTDPKRLKTIVEALSEQIINRGDKEFGKGNSKLLEPVGVYGISMDGSKRTYEIIDSDIKEGNIGANPVNENIQNQTIDNKEVEIKINNKNRFIVFGFGGMILGVVIMLMFIIYDSHIYTIDDMNNLTTLICLGVISNNNKVNNIVTAISLQTKDMKKCLITTIGESRKLEEIEEFNKCFEDNNTEVVTGIETNIELVKRLKDYDGVIIYIQPGYDDRETLDNALNKLEVTDANLLGYVIG